MMDGIELFLEGMASTLDAKTVIADLDDTWTQDGITLEDNQYDQGVKFGNALGKKVLFAKFTSGRGKIYEKHGITIRQWPDKRRVFIDVLYKKA